jgi:hypothetical protein
VRARPVRWQHPGHRGGRPDGRRRRAAILTLPWDIRLRRPVRRDSGCRRPRAAAEADARRGSHPYGEQPSLPGNLKRRLPVTLCPQEMTHFREIATRASSAFAASDAVATTSPKSFMNRTRSGMPLSMNVESVSAASNAIYLPCSIAVPISNPYVCNRGRRPSRCSLVAATIAAFPALRAAPMNYVRSSRINRSSE